MGKMEKRILTIGGIREDYCITHDGRVINGALGGNAIYAAVGAKLWAEQVSVLGRVGSNFPAAWFDDLRAAGIDASAVLVLPEPIPCVTFYAYLNPETRVDTSPGIHYARLGLPLPKPLVGYTSSTIGQDERNSFAPLAIRPNDLISLPGTIQAAHLAPADYLTHSLVPYALRQRGTKWITLDPSVRYMNPSFRHELPTLLRGLDAFLPSEQEARSYFAIRWTDSWQMAEAFGEMGVRFVVIKCGPRGALLWDRDAKARWQIPAYPSTVRDVTGAGDAFCGGFLAGLIETEDPLEASLWGSAAASLVVEGSGALYALDAAPGILHARRESLRSSARQV